MQCEIAAGFMVEPTATTRQLSRMQPKIGITDSSGGRLKKQITRGWQVLCTVAVPGERAQLIEADII
ncbi:MAG TPA: hypothetical protein VN961_07515, partial [Streptosporangiaceae bacterium]|nr:hypothetical protein [Streptosporangiaceae bacterium]